MTKIKTIEDLMTKDNGISYIGIHESCNKLRAACKESFMTKRELKESLSEWAQQGLIVKKVNHSELKTIGWCNCEMSK